MFSAHCSSCGAPVSTAALQRLTACCQQARCNGAGRARYAPAGVACRERARMLFACCDAQAAAARPGQPAPRRVAAW